MCWCTVALPYMVAPSRVKHRGQGSYSQSSLIPLHKTGSFNKESNNARYRISVRIPTKAKDEQKMIK